jgi:diamine N-acetyltransferase
LKLNFGEWKLPLENQAANDFQIVRDILLTTWLDTYSGIVPQEDLNAYLEFTCSDKKLKEILNDKLSKGIIAEADEKPAGWLRTSIQENKFLVNQLYVLREYQGKRIGKKLIGIAEEEALKNGFNKIWLGVMSENTTSVKWYQYLGFIFEKEEPFTMVNTKVNHLFGWKAVQK